MPRAGRVEKEYWRFKDPEDLMLSSVRQWRKESLLVYGYVDGVKTNRLTVFQEKESTDVRDGIRQGDGSWTARVRRCLRLK